MEDESTLTQTIAGAEDLNTQAVKPERNQQAGKPKDRIYEQSVPVAVEEQAAEEVETLQGSTPYTVTGDGQRFLINAVVETEPNAPLTVWTNWMAGVKK